MRITLISPHTHAGEPCSPGDTLDVNDIDAAWLITHHVGEPADDTAIHGDTIHE
jgi:hypothetical protein